MSDPTPPQAAMKKHASAILGLLIAYTIGMVVGIYLIGFGVHAPTLLPMFVGIAIVLGIPLHILYLVRLFNRSQQ